MLKMFTISQNHVSMDAPDAWMTTRVVQGCCKRAIITQPKIGVDPLSNVCYSDNVRYLCVHLANLRHSQGRIQMGAEPARAPPPLNPADI